MKRFTPKDASLTKKQIWSFFYDYQPDTADQYAYMEYATGNLVEKPSYKASEISNTLCQQFVDEESHLRYDFDSEEDFVEARDDLVAYFHRHILRALRRK